jgi:hypothetical protein
LVLPEHEQLRDELLEFEERSTTTGAFTFGARGSGHDDYVALLLTAAMADGQRQLQGSPARANKMVEALRRLADSGQLPNQDIGYHEFKKRFGGR